MSQLRQTINEVKTLANKNRFRGNSRNADEDLWTAIGLLANALELLEAQTREKEEIESD